MSKKLASPRPPKTPLGRRLADARRKAGLTTRELAAAAGLSDGHVTLIEMGRRKHPSAETVSGLAKALGVEMAWLLNGEGAGPVEPAKAGAA